VKLFGLALCVLVTASGSAQNLMNWGSTGNDLVALCKDNLGGLGHTKLTLFRFTSNS
jgi:hypothetical protein